MRTRVWRYVLPALAVLAATAGLAFPGQEPDGGSFAAPGPAAESFLYALQDNSGTTVYRYSPGGEASEVFADHETGIVIHDLQEATRLVVTPEGRLFAYARPRTPREADFFPRGQTVLRTERYRTYVYELSTDGSNNVRKVAEVLGTQSPRRFLVSTSGGYVAYFNVEWERDGLGISREYHWIYVHDTQTGELAWQIDAGLREYDNFRGAAWLDESRIYLWRLPVVEEHLAADQDFSKAVGPHVIDVRTGVAAPLEWDGFMAMLDAGEQSREDPGPDCSTALDSRTLVCTTNSSVYRRDPSCHSVLTTRSVFTIDLDGLKPTPVFSADSACADRWYLSPGTTYVVGLETRVDNYTIAGRRLLLYRTSQGEPVTTLVAETGSREPLLYPVGWMRD